MIHWLKAILRRALIVSLKIEVAGDVTASSRIVYIANHRSFLDGLILSLFLPRSPLAIVNSEEVKSWWRRALYCAVPHAIIDVRKPTALRALARIGDRSLVMFAEATHGDSFAAKKIYAVPAVFAAQCGAAIVTVHVSRREIRLYPALSWTKPASGSGKERRRQAVSQLRALMEETIAASAPRVTVFEALVDAAAVSGRRTRIVEDMRSETPQSYGQLLKTSLALGRWMSRFTREGEIVGILIPNLITTVGALLGAMAASRTPAMLNYTAGVAGIKNACLAANVKCIVTSRKFLAVIKASALPDSLPEFEWRFLEDFVLSPPDKLWLICYALWLPRRIVKNKDGARPAVVLFTSGSEDRPKGVALSHNALLANIWQMRALVDFGPQDKFFNPLPLHHSYSFTACTLMPLLSGTPFFLYPTPLHYRAIPEVFYRRRCTCLFGTGTFLARYAEHASAHDFARLRYVIAGGEKLRSEVQDLWMEKFGVRILEGYGATECAPVISLNVPHRFKKNSVGHLLPGVEHRLTSVPGIGGGALLHVRGPNLLSGYYRFERPGELQPPQSELGQGWYCTGDIVAIDGEGFVAIAGRVKRFAKIAGEMVSLEVVESIAVRASAQHQHAVIAQADFERGEMIVLFTTDPHLDRMALHRAALDAGLPTLALPRKIVQVRDIPLLGTGKTDYVELARTPIESSAAVQRVL